MYFFLINLKIYHFTLFQKPVIEISRKRTLVINIEYGNIVLILIVLKAQILSGKHWKKHFKASKFQNFPPALQDDVPAQRQNLCVAVFLYIFIFQKMRELILTSSLKVRMEAENDMLTKTLG